jgi:hypothetical protein
MAKTKRKKSTLLFAGSQADDVPMLSMDLRYRQRINTSRQKECLGLEIYFTLCGKAPFLPYTVAPLHNGVWLYY